MKKYLPVVLAAMLAVISCTGNKETYDWKPAGDRILTHWGETLDVTNVLPEYPRPQMERSEWMNLNGFWDFKSYGHSGKILVPFPLESALSGVGLRIGPDSCMVYTRTFTLPSKYLKGHVLLNCGGIDCISEIKLNGEYVRKHTGGYTAISEDITAQKANLQVSNSAGDTAILEVDVQFMGFNAFNLQTPNLSTYILYTEAGEHPSMFDYLDGIRRGTNYTAFEDSSFSRYADITVDTSEVDFDTPGVYKAYYTLTRLEEDSSRLKLGTAVMTVIVEEKS